MAEYVITVSGAAETADNLGRIATVLANLSAPMREIGIYLTRFYSGEVFASRGRVIGEPWAPLNSSYAVYKARRYPGRPPLVQTGAMMRGFKAQPAMTSVEIFNSDPKFEWHQEGTSRMPARVMMKLDEQRKKRVVDIVADYIAKEIAA